MPLPEPRHQDKPAAPKPQTPAAPESDKGKSVEMIPELSVYSFAPDKKSIDRALGISDY